MNKAVDYFDLLHNSALNFLNLDLSLELFLGSIKILWKTKLFPLGPII